MPAATSGASVSSDPGDPGRQPAGARTGTSRDLFGWSLGLGLLVVGWIEGALWTLTRVFILNFDVAGPNLTILLAFLLATGWVLLPLSRLEPDARLVYAASGLVGTAGFLASLVPSPLLAGLGAVVLVTALTVPVVGFIDALREDAVYGVTLGILLAVGLRVAANTASPYATTAGRLLFGTVILVTTAFLLVLAVRAAVPETTWAAVGPFPATACTLLVVAAGFLAQPHAVARWALRPYGLSILSLVLGVLAGLATARVRGQPTGRTLLALLGLYLVALGLLVYSSHPLTTVVYAVVWASAIALLPVGSRTRTRGFGAGWIAGLQLLALVLLALSISATHWAFMPFPLDLTRGYGTELTLLFLATYPLAVGLVGVTAPSGERAHSGVSSTATRRTTLSTIVAGVFPIGGYLLGRNSPGSDRPREERVRVMAYNLHVFFEGEETGQYSLAALRDVIDEDGADIVGVCESDGLRPLPGFVDGLRWLGDELGYHTVFGAPTRERSYGVGILSRWPLEDVEVIELPIGRSITRLAVVATARTPTGPLPVVSTHFMVGKEDDALDTRDEQAETIVDAMSGYDRGVALGDFNLTPDEVEYEILDDAFTDAWTAADDRTTSGNTYSAADPTERIDYVFLQGSWTVHEATTTGNSRASDHLAVVAEIEPSSESE